MQENQIKNCTPLYINGLTSVGSYEMVAATASESEGVATADGETRPRARVHLGSKKSALVPYF